MMFVPTVTAIPHLRRISMRGDTTAVAMNSRHDEQRLRVVITGGSAGIGAAMVRAFAKAGHHVLFTYLHSLASAKKLATDNPRTIMHRLDQGDVSSVLKFGAFVSEWVGTHGVDILVNNAALGSATVRRYVNVSRQAPRCNAHFGESIGATNGVCAPPAEDPPLPPALHRAAEDEALMRVNSLGPLWVTETLMPLIESAAGSMDPGRRSRASIIFIGSVGGGSAAVFPEYRASDLMGKAAMTYLAKHLAAEHVRSPVDVMCVSPGATETNMFRESTLSKMEHVDKFVDGMPKRRLIQPEDIAESVLWLSTAPAARVFHGAVLDASMGLAVRPGLQTEQSNR
jgi:NAD(P)-dependent dehydrogenase (short-subunit alcohol dehydrogenase family)